MERTPQKMTELNSELCTLRDALVLASQALSDLHFAVDHQRRLEAKKLADNRLDALEE
jgi:hypothetical protein